MFDFLLCCCVLHIEVVIMADYTARNIDKYRLQHALGKNIIACFGFVSQKHWLCRILKDIRAIVSCSSKFSCSPLCLLVWFVCARFICVVLRGLSPRRRLAVSTKDSSGLGGPGHPHSRTALCGQGKLFSLALFSCDYGLLAVGGNSRMHVFDVSSGGLDGAREVIADGVRCSRVAATGASPYGPVWELATFSFIVFLAFTFFLFSLSTSLSFSIFFFLSRYLLCFIS